LLITSHKSVKLQGMHTLLYPIYITLKENKCQELMRHFNYRFIPWPVSTKASCNHNNFLENVPRAT